MGFVHESVLLWECIDSLAIKKDGIYVDCTTGGAGHSRRIAERLTTGRLICIDRDEDALDVAKERLAGYECETDFVHDDFKNLGRILKGLGVEKADGVLMDLGVSSYQLDEASRGFSYMNETAPLDMRMDKSAGITAAEVLNTYSEEDLIRIFKEYGEEKNAKRIVREIAARRRNRTFETSGQLNEAIAAATPKNSPGGHPSKRVFMALRIEVNGELAGLNTFLDELPTLINDGGRICVISFHSLEDRIVKNSFKNSVDPCTCPANFPVCVCGKKPLGVLVNKKPVLPGEEEQRNNSRSKSAKLRVFERRYFKETS